MKLFGLYIGLASSVVERHTHDKLLTEGDTLRQFLNDEQGISAELRKSNRMLQEAEVGLKKQLESSRERETDLDRRIKSMESEIAGHLALSAAAQNGRLEHNDLLYRVGKSWLNFKSAWQFRKDNPKMAPKQRIENNQALESEIAFINDNLPKKIPDPSDLAIKEIADDPAPTKKSTR
jgi:hypothetical protein